MRSVKIIDPAATGKAGTAGVYRSPFSLPNGEILASYDGAVTDPAARTPHYALVAVNDADGRPPHAGQRRQPVVRRGGARLQARRAAAVQEPAAAGVRRPHRTTRATHGIMHFPDAPVLATLLGANLRQRPQRPGVWTARVALKVYEEQPAAATPDAARARWSTRSRTSLGQASFEADHSLKVLVPGRQAADPRVRRRQRQPGLHDDRGAPGDAGRVHHPGPPRALFNNICGGCHGSIERLGAGRRGQRRRPDRRVGVAVAQPVAEEPAVARAIPPTRRRRGIAEGGGYGEMISSEKRRKHDLWIIWSMCCRAATDGPRTPTAATGAAPRHRVAGARWRRASVDSRHHRRSGGEGPAARDGARGRIRRALRRQPRRRRQSCSTASGRACCWSTWT